MFPQNVQLSISKLEVSLAGLEQGQRSTTNRRTATTRGQDSWAHLAFRVHGG